MPSDPSEATIRDVRSKPDTDFSVLDPVWIISPDGRTTSSHCVLSFVSPYFSARLPAAFVFIMPPIVHDIPLEGSGGNNWLYFASFSLRSSDTIPACSAVI